MSNILLVPVHLDALVLNEDTMVVEAMADFSRLPYCDGTQDVNPDVANISEEIVSTPFENQNLPLKAGVHLHWSLPDALTRARQAKEDPNGQDFPPVPNRWLVTRCNADGGKVKEWIVESDYLYPPTQQGATVQPSGSVAVPHQRGQAQPFRYMGRSIELSASTELTANSSTSDQDEYPKLTAVGYGEPTFAAFYPNCYSVFGFFDPDYSGKSDGRQYYLLGWYSHPAQDLPGLFTSARGALPIRLAARPKFWGVRRITTQCQEMILTLWAQLSPIKALEDDFKWTFAYEDIPGLYGKEQQARVSSHIQTLKQNRDQQEMPSASALIESIKKGLGVMPEPGKTFPVRTLYYAKLSLKPEADVTKDSLDEVSDPTIAVGNTGTEALSSYLAATIKNGVAKNIIEEQLEAVQLSERLEHRQLDVGAKFFEARHEKGFTSIPGGSLWTVRAETMNNAAADASNAEAGITLPGKMADLLNDVNDQQQGYDRAAQEIESMRRQLFSDWYKYMLCAYPPEDSRDDYPDIDEVKSYLEFNIASLKDKIGHAEGRAQELLDTIKNLQAKIDEPNSKSALFSTDDFISPASLIQKLKARQGQDSSQAVSKYIYDKLSPSTRELLDKDDTSKGPNEELLTALAADLNLLLTDSSLYAKERFARIQLSNAAEELTSKDALNAAELVCLNRVLLEAAYPQDIATKTFYTLKQISGPRYWQPTEPVVLIKGSIAEPSERHGQDGRASDGLLEIDIWVEADMKNLRDENFRETIRKRVDAISGRAGSFASTDWTAQPWNPFLLEWEVEVFPFDNKSNLDPATGRYHTDFIGDNYLLKENEADLSIPDLKGSTTKAACLYSGRSILTPHAGIQLTKQIEAFLAKASWLLDASDVRDAAALCAELKNGTGDVTKYLRDRFIKSTTDLLSTYTPGREPTGQLVNAVVNELNLGIKDPGFPKSKTVQTPSIATDELKLAELMRANRMSLEDAYSQGLAQTSHDTRLAFDHILEAWEHLINKDFSCLSQSLGGFNEALLMHKQTMQLHVSDPLGFDDYQSFAASVSDAVSNSIYSAPEPLNDFNPIRSGAMKILRLRLVDTFGRVKDLIVKDVITSEPMTISDTEYPVRLAPRLVQPARINFRWLAAEGDKQEMNDHPAKTPICGWVLTNNLDNSLMIYDGAGKALGSLDENAEWEPAPGSYPQIDDPQKISNVHLSKMVTRLLDCGADFLKQFISAIDRALENIEPENFAQHQDLALLMGRPIALVRAALNLELQGLPSCHQGWNEFRQDMQRSTRDDNGFSEVQFPIRLGQFEQFNDGLVGYWKENAEADLKKNWFFAPQSDDETEISDERIKTHRTADKEVLILQTVNSEPQILSMLVDPRGLVHATSGILPAKAISIPPDQYGAALQNIEITFLSTPIITDVGKIHLPLPAEAGYKWSWLQDEAGVWSEVSTSGVVQIKAVIETFGQSAWDELKTKKWLKQVDENRAGVTAKDDRSPDALSAALTEKIPEIEDFLDRSHLGPVNPVAKFSGPQEIHEGWLKLSVDDGSA